MCTDRSRVLRHHPDKKPKKKDGMDDDDIFKCIKIGMGWIALWIWIG